LTGRGNTVLFFRHYHGNLDMYYGIPILLWKRIMVILIIFM